MTTEAELRESGATRSTRRTSSRRRNGALGSLPRDRHDDQRAGEPSGVADPRFVWYTERSLYQSDLPTGEDEPATA